MKDKVLRKETKSHIASAEEIKKNKHKFTITIIDNETKEVMLNERTDAVIGIVHLPDKDTKESTATQKFCSTACGTRTLVACLKNLEEFHSYITLQMFKESMRAMLED